MKASPAYLNSQLYQLVLGASCFLAAACASNQIFNSLKQSYFSKSVTINAPILSWSHSLQMIHLNAANIAPVIPLEVQNAAALSARAEAEAIQITLKVNLGLAQISRLEKSEKHSRQVRIAHAGHSTQHIEHSVSVSGTTHFVAHTLSAPSMIAEMPISVIQAEEIPAPEMTEAERLQSIHQLMTSRFYIAMSGQAPLNTQFAKNVATQSPELKAARAALEQVSETDAAKSKSSEKSRQGSASANKAAIQGKQSIATIASGDLDEVPGTGSQTELASIKPPTQNIQAPTPLPSVQALATSNAIVPKNGSTKTVSAPEIFKQVAMNTQRGLSTQSTLIDSAPAAKMITENELKSEEDLSHSNHRKEISPSPSQVANHNTLLADESSSLKMPAMRNEAAGSSDQADYSNLPTSLTTQNSQMIASGYSAPTVPNIMINGKTMVSIVAKPMAQLTTPFLKAISSHPSPTTDKIKSSSSMEAEAPAEIADDNANASVGANGYTVASNLSGEANVSAQNENATVRKTASVMNVSPVVNGGVKVLTQSAPTYETSRRWSFAEAFDWSAAVTDAQVEILSREGNSSDVEMSRAGWRIAKSNLHWNTLFWSRAVTSVNSANEEIPVLHTNAAKMLAYKAGVTLQSDAGIVLAKVPAGWSLEFSGRAEHPLIFDRANHSVSASALESDRYYIFLNASPGEQILYLTRNNGETGALAMPILSGMVAYADLTSYEKRSVTGRVLDAGNSSARGLSGVHVQVVGSTSSAVTGAKGVFKVENVLTFGDQPLYLETESAKGYPQRYKLAPNAATDLTLFSLTDEQVHDWISQLEGGISSESGLIVGALPTLASQEESQKLTVEARSLSVNPTLTPETYTMSSTGQLLVKSPLTAAHSRFISVQVPDGPALIQVVDKDHHVIWSEITVISPRVLTLVGPY